ncbi:exosortase A [Sphingomonas sp. Leaf407]|uniref:exosortase A n=1 Tax=unclassified Sphingomonas TaxID=196159 RepID=UPI0006F638D2|nr:MULTISPECIES: exosortase A [unclassified Sphingomonas]KQN36979.1 exosortase A [Sphingomonas sp. Leaf42]KQT30406.1 exosortase A [Sphingomonas sp. Leaf407]
MTIALSSGPAKPRTADAAWRASLLALAGLWVALLLLFRRDVGDVVGIWWNSTTYGHCLFVPPILGWLVWQRRADLAQVRPAAWAPGLLWVAAGGVVWLIGEAAAVALFRHAGLVLLLQGAAITLLGRRVAQGLAFPLAYMAFLVPFGDFLEPRLQAATVDMTMPLLHLLGVPARVDGVLITIPGGYFEVAEACSGAKFLIAMVAYGALVANVCYVGWRRRAGFMAMAIVVPILANGLRAAGTIYAAHLTSVEAATGFDHIVYGWVFFALTMAAVLALGWRWFDRDPDAPWFDAARLAGLPMRSTDRSLAAGAVLGIAVAFAAWGHVIDTRAQPLPQRIDLPAVPGWQRVAITGEPWVPHYPGADHFLIGRYGDGQGRQVDMAIAVYGSQGEGHELVGFGQGAIRENDRWVRVADTAPIAGGAALRMAAPGPVERETATWYRVGDVVTGDPDRVKLETLKVRLLGGPQRGVAILLSAQKDAHEPRAAISAFLKAAGPVAAIADHAAGMR